eukprot:CAMPEP_0172479696 /NCGR_PEP_ID=MMETSP1066-20121228/4470_1 /TAXON_ID=671091 /ORGANISM="Coscinodiscus wailesii, Strain CCMP2513" /LENGTH=224 /DNA_ID=CAMNT_0013240395 /DNA_START=124 /DNA_END=798 /DNA_ORIENTATION=-
MWTKNADDKLSIQSTETKNAIFRCLHEEAESLRNLSIDQQIGLRDFEANLIKERKDQISPSPCSVLSLASVDESLSADVSNVKAKKGKWPTPCLKISKIDEGIRSCSSPSWRHSLKRPSGNGLKRKVSFHDHQDVQYFDKKPWEGANETWLNDLEIDGDKCDVSRKGPDLNDLKFRKTIEVMKELEIKVPEEPDQLFLALYLNLQNAYRACCESYKQDGISKLH